MSLRYLSYTGSVLSFLVIVLSVSGRADAGIPLSVQTYTDDALPIEPPLSGAYPGRPLSAGSLTLEDVLNAHAPAKKSRERSSGPAATEMMMSQGIDAVLKKYTMPPTKAPESSLIGVSAIPQPSPEAAMRPAKESAVQYRPGQAPKNLGSEEKNASTETDAKTDGDTDACVSQVRKWEKSCIEAGYPPSFVGKVVGETRIGCTDDSLHDFWVTNTCAPPEQAPDATSKEEQEASSEEKAEDETPSVLSDKAEVPKIILDRDEDEDEDEDEEIKDKNNAQTEKSEDSEPRVDIPDARELSAARLAASNATEDLCGEASEIMAYEAPDKNLCRVGSSSAVNGSGPWTWTCTNVQGAVSTCKTLSLKGTEQDSAPALGNSSDVSPAPEPVPESAKTEPTSDNSGHYLRLQPAPTPSAPAVEPVCGSADGETAKKAPVSRLCKEGKASKVRGANPWKWDCIMGKKKVSCATKKVSAEAVVSKEKAPVVLAPQESFLKSPASAAQPVEAKEDEPPENTLAPSVSESKEAVPAAQQEPETKPSTQPRARLELTPEMATIAFEPNSETAAASAQGALDKLAAALSENTDARISLISYAEGSEGNPQSAHRLSLARALAVRAFLSSKGIPESRMDVRAEGSNVPSGSPDRVDVKVND